MPTTKHSPAAQSGMLDVHASFGGAAIIDACVPTDIALRLLVATKGHVRDVSISVGDTTGMTLFDARVPAAVAARIVSLARGAKVAVAVD